MRPWVLATLANPAAQRMVIAIDIGNLGFALAVVGTGVGLGLKHLLDMDI